SFETRTGPAISSSRRGLRRSTFTPPRLPGGVEPGPTVSPAGGRRARRSTPRGEDLAVQRRRLLALLPGPGHEPAEDPEGQPGPPPAPHPLPEAEAGQPA